MQNMKKMGCLIAVFMLVFIVFFSGCVSQVGGLGSLGASDRDLIQQGLDEGSQSCIDNTPRGQSTDKCILSSSQKEKVTRLLIARISVLEQRCLETLPRSQDASECQYNLDEKKILASRCFSCGDESHMPNILYHSTEHCIELNTPFDKKSGRLLTTKG